AAVLAPPVPENLQASTLGSVTVLSWELPSSFSTAVREGLTYQVILGSSPGAIDIISPLSRPANGFRRVDAPGESKLRSRLVSNLPPGTYYWRVQSIGPNLQASTFSSPQQNFTVTATATGTAKFSDATASGFAPNGSVPPGLEQATLTWGDVDEDGDLDFIASGAESFSPSTVLTTRLFINQEIALSGATFGFQEQTGTGLPGIQLGEYQFGDFDNDNDLDVAVVGISSVGQGIARVYENLPGSSSLFSSTPINLPGNTNFSQASLDWGDFDNDGDQDLVIVGLRSGSPSAVVYRNEFIPSGTATFTALGSALPTSTGVSNGDVAFADFNRDGFEDIILAGNPNPGMGVPGNAPIARIYLNNGDETFTSTFQLKGAVGSSIAVGDLNNDQWLDLVISGFLQSNLTQPATTVYRNLLAGGAGFLEVTLNTPITGVGSGSVSLGDYDDDGTMDLLLTGANSAGNPTTLVYQNQSSPLSGIDFVQDAPSSTVFLDVNSGSQAHWADVDNDRKLDFVLVGLSGGTRQFKLYRNIDGSANLRPEAPQNLATDIFGFEVELSWDPPSNISLATRDGLYYNILLREVGNSVLLRTPEAEENTGSTYGFRRVVGPGNLNQELSLTLDDLTPGMYQWTVQAIDQDWEGSEFAALQTFTFEDPSFIDVSSTDLEQSTLLKLRDASIAFADYDNDGDLDFAAMGQSSGLVDTLALYEYDGSAQAFAGDAANSVFLPSVRNGDLAWGDLNNDNLPDLAIIGENASGNQALVKVNFSGGFSNLPSTEISLNSGQGVRNGAITWGDYNNDGFQDLVLMGESGVTNKPTVEFHLNDRNNGLLPQGPLGVIELTNGDLAFGDFNQDAWLDLVITGEDASGIPRTRLYLNDQQGGFINFAIQGLPGLTSSALAVGDYNADGLLDLAITGSNGTQPLARVFENTGDFSSNTALVNLGAPTTGVLEGAIAFGDYDNDGYQDLVIAGQDGNSSGDLSARLYRYDNGAGQFVLEDVQGTPLADLGEGSDIAWGDYNQDGKLDLLMAGKLGTGSTQNTLSLFRNINANPPSSPGVPGIGTHANNRYEVT
ncbi:MAG: FG-GAP-like repeat-containing protein, partial [Bacteroidota bacterium]